MWFLQRSTLWKLGCRSALGKVLHSAREMQYLRPLHLLSFQISHARMPEQQTFGAEPRLGFAILTPTPNASHSIPSLTLVTAY